MSLTNILIVDDNPNNIYAIKSVLSKLEGYNIIEALNGQEALKICSVEKIDLILLDIQMPEMDGFEVAGMLKSVRKTKNIPIIFLTAVFKDDTFIRRGFEIGAIDYITKPINKYSLITKIQLYKHIETQNLSENKKRILPPVED